MIKKVCILGQEYTVNTECEELNSINADGMCKVYVKEIQIRPIDNLLDEQDTEKEKRKRYEEVVRHEIAHAFLFENGLDDYARDEKIVQWIAVQLLKIYKVCEEVLKDE